MKAETIRKIFNKNKEYNFRIVTNIPEGKGINGVNYKTYYGKKLVVNSDKRKLQTTHIVKIEDDYVLVIFCDNDDWLSNGSPIRIYIDVNSIVSIDIFTTDINNNMGLNIPSKF